MPAKRRPRPHTTLDREYLNQDTIRELGERLGPAGPLVFLAIILEAGKVTSGTPGVVELRFRSVAQLAFTNAETVCDVVRVACEVGLLADVGIDGERFTARLTRWDEWEAKDPTAAKRAAEYRARREPQA